MQQLVLVGPGELRWDEADDPVFDDPEQALVHPIALATCDLDIAVLAGNFPLAGPYPFGHEAVAEVVAVGDDVRTVAPGDRVVVPFQISCGRCEPCRRGRTGSCATYPPRSAYGLGTIGGLGWGSLGADLAVVPHADAMLVALPDGIAPATVASASDNIPDAWRTVGPQLAADPTAEVLIVGGEPGRAPASIGLYAAGIAVALGAPRVVYADTDAERLALAAALGAEAVETSPSGVLGSFPITVDASGTAAGLRWAIESTAPDGTCTSPSIYLEDVPLPLLSMYGRCCTFHTGRVHARAGIGHVLDVVLAGFDPSVVTTTLAAWDDAPDALADPTVKAVLTR